MNLPKLPEPNAFTLDEIAARWHCIEDDLIRYFEVDMLEIKIDMTGIIAKYLDVRGFDTAMYENDNFELKGLYLATSEAIEATWNLENNPQKDCVKSINSVNGCHGDTYLVSEKIVYNPRKLQITKEERDRFEAEHNIFNESEAILSKLASSPYWNKLQLLANKAIDQYPDWEARQRAVQKSANLNVWLRNIIGANTREAEIIKKVLTEIFNIKIKS